MQPIQAKQYNYKFHLIREPRQWCGSGYGLWCGLCQRVWALVLSPTTEDFGPYVRVKPVNCAEHGEGWLIDDFMFDDKSFDPTRALEPLDLLTDLEARVRAL